MQSCPTAQASLAEMVLAAYGVSVTPGAGLATLDHVVPFQCSMSGTQCWMVVLQDDPAAQALPAEEALTADRKLAFPATFGLATRDQDLPFQCMISVVSVAHRCGQWTPTSQALPAETALMSTALFTVGSGMATGDHAEPFQCRTTGVVGVVRSCPTAQALRAEVALTCSSCSLVPALRSDLAANRGSGLTAAAVQGVSCTNGLTLDTGPAASRAGAEPVPGAGVKATVSAAVHPNATAAATPRVIRDVAAIIVLPAGREASPCGRSTGMTLKLALRLGPLPDIVPIRAQNDC